MSTNQQYINITNNTISGYNNGINATINLATQSSITTVIGLNYSTTNLGFEFLPNPNDNGILRYRYSENSTTTIFGFEGTNLYMNIKYINANVGSFVNPANDITGVNIFIDPLTNGGSIAVNTDIGYPRILTNVDENQSGQIQFFCDDYGTQGTIINVSSITTQHIIVSSLEAAIGIILHSPDDITVSSMLYTDIAGNLYWNGQPIISGSGSGSSIQTSSFLTVYTSSIQTTGVSIRGRNGLKSAQLVADAELNLYWNGTMVTLGNISQQLNDIFITRTFEYADIVKVSTGTILTSTIQGVYDEPSILMKWLFVGRNIEQSPVLISYDNKFTTFQGPGQKGLFSGGGNSVYASNKTGRIIAVGSDNDSNYLTIQTSADGNVYNYITTNNPFSASAYVVYYVNNIWLIGGSSAPGVPPIIWSEDGINFFPPDSFPTAGGSNAYAFSYDGAKYIVALDITYTAQTSLLWSYDGKFWNPIESGGFSEAAYAVGNNGQFWVACGVTDIQTSNSRIQWSTDGVNWNVSLNIPLGFQYGNCVTYNNGLWIIGGYGGGNTAILTSTDGKYWLSQEEGFMEEVNQIIFAQNSWYAVGKLEQNQSVYEIMSSSDGYNWTSINGTRIYDQSINDLFFLDTILVGHGSINFTTSTSLYVTETMSSLSVNTTNLIAETSKFNSVEAAAVNISTLYANSIISPTSVQVQTIQF
jgi:hypothetical protein